LPTIERNLAVWNAEYDWSFRGEEWSLAWGGAEQEWSASILPRIRRFLPARRVLEIGPGFGRWTAFLVDSAEELLLADISQRCLDACRERFGAISKIQTLLTDGHTLPAADRSIDFVFSFDSLVHAEADVMQSYARELARVLAPDGAAFLHHSNLGAYSLIPFKLANIPIAGALLQKAGIADKLDGWRARTVTAAAMRRWVEEAGLVCASQELINWGTTRLIDCITVVARPGSRHDRRRLLVRNPHFRCEAASARLVSEIYGGA
jgi:ubiquinone/menaquinone biosynthesis C-methylase UbiE